MSRLTNSTNDIINGKAKQIDMIKDQQIYLKLKTLEDIEDELGCPLDVVFEAINTGIWFKSDDFITKNLEKDLATRPRLYYSDDFKCYRFEIGFGLHYVALKDYKKTWWLVSDKESDE